MDLINRYNNGELNSEDSIVFPESQRYQTLTLHRTVYGGGGIMPDYFVPVDTSSYSEYYRQLINKGILNRFVLQWVDDHRDEMLSRFPDFDSYRSGFSPGNEETDALVAFAKGEDLPFNREQWDVSEGQISMLVKAYIARDLWSMARFYEIYNASNEVFNKAVEILDNPAQVYQKLAKAERE
jgi:carboxyl-terminal processing protease